MPILTIKIELSAKFLNVSTECFSFISPSYQSWTATELLTSLLCRQNNLGTSVSTFLNVLFISHGRLFFRQYFLLFMNLTSLITSWWILIKIYTSSHFKQSYDCKDKLISKIHTETEYILKNQIFPTQHVTLCSLPFTTLKNVIGEIKCRS